MYNFKDNEMMDALRASIEEAQPIQSPEVGTHSVTAVYRTVLCCAVMSATDCLRAVHLL